MCLSYHPRGNISPVLIDKNVYLNANHINLYFVITELHRLSKKNPLIKSSKYTYCKHHRFIHISVRIAKFIIDRSMSSDQCHVYLILLLIVFCRSSCSVTINLSGPTLCVLSFNVSWLKNSRSFSFVLLVTCQSSVSVILKKVILPVLLESESFSILFQITQHHGIVHKMSSNSG